MATKKKRTMIDVDASGKVIEAPHAPVIPINKPTLVEQAGNIGFFSRVVSNVKGRDMNIPLGACTAVVSERNRAGKTAVLDAFRLALTGKHPIGPDAVDLAGLTVDGSLPFARLMGGSAAMEYRFPDGKKTPVITPTGDFQSLQPDDLHKLLPLVSNRELLTLGTAKAREGLFRRFGGVLLQSATSAPLGLTPEQVALWDKAIAGEGHPGADPVEQLAAAGTWIRSHKRGLSGRMKALEEEKQRLHELAVAAGAGTPTDDLLRVLQEKIDQHKAFESTRILRERAAVSESRLVGLIEKFKVTPKPIDDLGYEQAQLEIHERHPTAELEKTVAEGVTYVEARKKDVRLFTMMVGLQKHVEQTGTCLVCHTNLCDARGFAGIQLQGFSEESTAALADATEKLRLAELSLANDRQHLHLVIRQRDAELKQFDVLLQHERRVYENLVQDLKAEKRNYEEVEKLLAAIGPGTVPAEPLPVLYEQLRALQAAKAEMGRATQLAIDIRTLATEQEDTKTIEKALGTRFNELVASVRKAAQDAVNAWMPPGFVAALMLEDEDGKPACRWEIVGADGRPHPRGAASGAEWAALTVAIACAWSDGQKYRFLLLDDSDLAGFSAENVRNALTMVQQAVAAGRLTQALVAWSRPKEIPDKGWNVVSL